MALWRDPLDELIDELDTAFPPAPDDAGWTVFPVADLQLALAGVFEGRPPTPEQEHIIARFKAHLEAVQRRHAEAMPARNRGEDAS
jgi:hypothetical protein